jgi:DnaA family protein
VTEALRLLRERLRQLEDKSDSFALVYLYGPPGSGRSHLAHGILLEAAARGIPEDRLVLIELDESVHFVPREDLYTANFISRYEELRRTGGLLLVVGAGHPEKLKLSPHLRSRLLAGDIVELKYPTETELQPLIRTLFEKRNIRVNEATIDFLISRLPVDPLSFADISAKIERISAVLGKPVRLGFVRDVVSGKTSL